MNSLNLFVRQCRRNAVTGGMLMAIGVLSLAPAMTAMADTITDRSIELSSSVEAAENVTYNTTFTTASGTTGAFVIDFCNDSAAIGATCTPPPGLDATNVSTATAGYTVSSPSTSSVEVVITTPVAASSEVNVVLENIDNPTNAGVLYARIVTYADSTASGTYTSTSPGTYIDEGSVALSITEGTNVGGTVLETLTFCVSGDPLTDGCNSGLVAPNVVLGTDGVLTTTTSTGDIHSGISTNASGGAIVSLKSDAVGCGGLERAGAPDECDIAPITTAAATLNENLAQFGLKLANITSTTGGVSPETGYSTANYFMGYVDETDGVTSPYGDPVYNTNGSPITEGRVDLVFGAKTIADTPAGNYSANLSLIATGTF